jgi:hypothetical protein
VSDFNWPLDALFLQEAVEVELHSFPHGRPYFERVLAVGASDDDKKAGAHLIFAAHNRQRGLIALWLYCRLRPGECSVALYREAFDST